jgi:(1->4)-alpha-D-glucan 1-alpha-D-glucosylmutase
MAKGMEDNALYIHNRLVSLNEVGGEPERFGVSVAAFHHLTAEQAKRWPHAMLSTSTHDTKRSEDVRVRIDVLSEIPDEWVERLERWAQLNRSRRREVDGQEAPSRNDEYLLYQTLVGAWPPEKLNDEELTDFRGRIKAYMEKALREAQVHTSWVNVNEEYEAAVADFVEALLTPSETNLFLGEFVPFARRVARLGALNSLSQTLIKLTAPGVPDVYQGNELWDFSLVDPDNRRPVDYGLRKKLLAELEGIEGDDVRNLLEAWQDGRPKLHVTRGALALRKERADLFEKGEYVPLEVSGAKADHIVAFARLFGGQATVTIAPRLHANLTDISETLPANPEVWEGTSVDVSELPVAQYRNVLTGEMVEPEDRDGEKRISVETTSSNFPVALLVSERTED